MNIKLYYYSKGNNFGDVINPYVLEKIFNHHCEAANAGDAQLFMIGSILNKAMVRKSKWVKRICGAFASPLHIWSSGFIDDDLGSSCALRKLNVCALRGKLSKGLLEKITGKPLDIPLGDGGLLISRLFDTLPEKKYSVGIIPHFADENMPELRAISQKIPGSVIISPVGDPLECALKIAECETVISSSLHGLIAADSFGIPNRQMVLSDNIKGGLFKYRDYYSVFGEDADPLMLKDLLTQEITSESIRKDYRISQDRVAEIQDQLIAAFPFRS